jgi:hypothetical protein
MQSINNDFSSVAVDEWRLAGDMEERQRDLLLQDIPFVQILALLAKHVKLRSIRREAYKKAPHDYSVYHRVVLVLDVEPEAVALFHNSRCGYRAQYYHSVQNGERANELAVRTLIPKVKELLAGGERAKWALVEKSLSSSEAKVWIHQGFWLRYRPLSDRKILVQRWVSKLKSPLRCDRKKAMWGTLCASGENRIEIKGAFVDADGTQLSVSLKPFRGEQIHEFGFT